MNRFQIANKIGYDRKLLLMVSGGMDSMALFYACQKENLPFAVVHINHGLRGEESDGDMEFVQSQCQLYDVLCFVLEDTTFSKPISSGNLQELARDVRYGFAHNILERHGYDYICTAHHSTDQVDTMIFRMIRGTGLKGLTSMKAIDHSTALFRPLLDISRKEIEDYIFDNNIPFREDSSNASLKYSRNKIEQLVRPNLIKINKDAERNILNTIDHLQSTYGLLQALVQRERKSIIDDSYYGLTFIKILNDLGVHRDEFYRQLLTEFELNTDQVHQILESRVGARLELDSSTIYKDRDHLIVEHEPNSPVYSEIHKEGQYKIDETRYFSIVKYEGQELKESEQLVFNLDFPLILRNWVEGDRIKTKGGTKKIKKLLTDLKIPLPLKKRTLVLSNEKGICDIIYQGHPQNHSVLAMDTKAYVVRDYFIESPSKPLK